MPYQPSVVLLKPSPWLAFNTVNPSYGANSPTKFNVATLVNDQTNITLDYAKDLDVNWSSHP